LEGEGEAGRLILFTSGRLSFFLFFVMVNLRTICRKVTRGAVNGIRYGHNQYGDFESTNIWTSEQWIDGIYPTNEFLQTLGAIWATMFSNERTSWTTLSIRNRTSCYAEFTRWNFRLMMIGLEPVKTPF
jgi:hypothetical protein